MSEENKQPTINQQLRRNYKEHFADKTALVSILMLVITICLILGFLFPLSLLITIPFIALPTFFGSITENSAINIGLGKPLRIFKGFKLYFKNAFFGCFKVIGGLFKFLLCYLIVSSLCSIIFHFSIGLNDPEYVAIFERIANLATSEELQQIIVDLEANSTYMLITNLNEIISFGLASYLFLHHILTHSFKIGFSFGDNHFVEMRHINIIHRYAFPQFRKDFYKEYYASFWLIFTLFVLGYVGGALIGFALNRSGIQCGIIGLFLGNLLTVYFLPYFYDTYQVLFSIEIRFYLKAFLELDNSAYFQFKKYLNDKDRAEVKARVKFADEIFSSTKEEMKDNKKE